MCCTHFTENNETNLMRHNNDDSHINDQNTPFSETTVYMVPHEEDILSTDDNLINASMRPSSIGVDYTNLSASNDSINQICVSYASLLGTCTDISDSDWSPPAEHESSCDDDSFLSPGSDLCVSYPGVQ